MSSRKLGLSNSLLSLSWTVIEGVSRNLRESFVGNSKMNAAGRLWRWKDSLRNANESLEFRKPSFGLIVIEEIMELNSVIRDLKEQGNSRAEKIKRSTAVSEKGMGELKEKLAFFERSWKKREGIENRGGEGVKEADAEFRGGEEGVRNSKERLS